MVPARFPGARRQEWILFVTPSPAGGPVAEGRGGEEELGFAFEGPGYGWETNRIAHCPRGRQRER